MAEVAKRADKLAARAAFEDPRFHAEVAKVAARVRAEAAPHHETGAFEGGIHVVDGRLTSYVTTSDKLALHKEFGHKQGSKWVRGIFAFTNAARKAG